MHVVLLHQVAPNVLKMGFNPIARLAYTVSPNHILKSS